MMLYEVPRNTLIAVTEPDWDGPELIKFYHIDGMYSYCRDMSGNVIHLKAWTEVEIVKIKGESVWAMS